MEALIRFMYHGEVHIGQDQLPDFLRTAQTLQVRGLAEVSSKDQHKLSVSYFIYYIICDVYVYFGQFLDECFSYAEKVM